MRPDLTDTKKGTSAVDLAVEAKFLASIDHTNIIKLRATVSKPGHESFMIVLDRLYSVLDKTIVTWRDQQKAARGMLGLRVVRKVDYYRGKTERLVALYDIARALKHLHNLRIIFRDLKPEYVMTGRVFWRSKRFFTLTLSLRCCCQYGLQKHWLRYSWRL